MSESSGNDWKQMKARLEAADRKAFIRFYRESAYRVPNLYERREDIPRNSVGEFTGEVYETWRKSQTKFILSTREKDPSIWNRACDWWGITTDVAAQRTEASEANRIARKALSVSIVAAIVTILVSFTALAVSIVQCASTKTEAVP